MRRKTKKKAARRKLYEDREIIAWTRKKKEKETQKIHTIQAIANTTITNLSAQNIHNWNENKCGKRQKVMQNKTQNERTTKTR